MICEKGERERERKREKGGVKEVWDSK